MTTDFECPHCGYPACDAWEYLDGDETCTVQCDMCDEEFLLSQEVTVVYSTHIIVDNKSKK
jgi:transcription elongation factor Elf1